MKKTGNTAANKIYNPKNIKSPIPVDVDEVDSALERFIRQKYELRTLEDGKPKPPSRQDPSYISKRSEESSPPPPLPPKPTRRFGFGLRSISSATFSGSDKSSNRRDHLNTPAAWENNKQSRGGFGSLYGDSDRSLESKLEVLREMGFPDDKRNATVLRGLNGDVEKTIDSLARLGENVRSRSPGFITAHTGARTPNSGNKLTPPSTSTNPFDKMGSTSSRSSAGISVNRPASQSTVSSAEQQQPQQPPELKRAASYNPFDTMGPQTGSTPALEQSFQQLQVSQPLFPNTTGGYPSQQQQQQYAQAQSSIYSHSMTPPVTTTPGLPAPSPASLNGNSNPFFQQTTPTTNVSNTMPQLQQTQSLSPTNPFFGQNTSLATSSAAFSQQTPTYTTQQSLPGEGAPRILQHANTMPTFTSQAQSYPVQQPANNPFFSQPNSVSPSYQTQFNQQQQQQLQQQQLLQQHQLKQQQFQQQQQLQLQQQQQQQQHMSQMPSYNNRMDKSNILALYNFSQPPPTIPEQSQVQQPQTAINPPILPQIQTQPQPGYTFPSQTSPMVMSAPADASSKNPFFTSQNAMPNNNVSAGAPQQINGRPPFMRTHMSQESMDIGRAQNGRHSPDAFASLSARYT